MRTRRPTRWLAAAAAAAAALAGLACASSPGAPARPLRLEAERMQIVRGPAEVVRDSVASGGRGLLLAGRGRARARLRLPAAVRIRVVARARACRGAPLLAVGVDGHRAALLRVRGSRWSALSARIRRRAGGHMVALSLANPAQAPGCRRAVVVDSLRFERVRQRRSPRIRRPAPSTTWQWQLTGPIDTSASARLFDVDLFDTPASVVRSLRRGGRHAICYTSVGSLENWRPDAASFPASVVGKPLSGWPGERWLDIRRLDVLGPIIERRLDLCRRKGFDGVEPDNVDAYQNDSGFPLSARDQLAFNRFVARGAHARGLSVGLKNDLDQVAELEPAFDWALNEECFRYSECERLLPFVRARKAVFTVEYGLTTDQFCAEARRLGFMSMRKRESLDAWRETCW